MAKKKEGLRLVIELDADEAEQFRDLANTDDAEFYEGIAKSLVLGAGKVVDPQFVFDDIQLLTELAEYGRRGDLPALQEWSDELSFTREQLENQSVKDAICSWAVYFSDTINELASHQHESFTDQTRWFGNSIWTSFLLGSLRKTITSILYP